MPRVVRTVGRAVIKSSILLLILAWFVPLADASGQSATISGVVIDSLSGRPPPRAGGPGRGRAGGGPGGALRGGWRRRR